MGAPWISPRQAGTPVLLSTEFAAKSSANFGQIRGRFTASCRTVFRPDKAPGPSAVPAAFQIGGAHFWALQQVGSGSAQRDQAVDHDIAAVGELEGVIGVLLDDQHGEAVLPVQGADRIEDLAR